MASDTDHILTNEQIDEIAEKAAKKAVGMITAELYQNVGKSVVDKVFWVIGIVAVGLYFWLQSKGVKL